MPIQHSPSSLLPTRISARTWAVGGPTGQRQTDTLQYKYATVDVMLLSAVGCYPSWSPGVKGVRCAPRSVHGPDAIVNLSPAAKIVHAVFAAENAACSYAPSTQEGTVLTLIMIVDATGLSSTQMWRVTSRKTLTRWAVDCC